MGKCLCEDIFIRFNETVWSVHSSCELGRPYSSNMHFFANYISNTELDDHNDNYADPGSSFLKDLLQNDNNLNNCNGQVPILKTVS